MNIISLALSPKGTVKRLPFFWMQVAYWVIFILLGQASGYAAYFTMEDVSNVSHADILLSINGIISFIIFIGVVYSAICVNIKRFRDMGHSPWFILLLLIPIVNIIVLLFLFFAPSKET